MQNVDSLFPFQHQPPYFECGRKNTYCRSVANFIPNVYFSDASKAYKIIKHSSTFTTAKFNQAAVLEAFPDKQTNCCSTCEQSVQHLLYNQQRLSTFLILSGILLLTSSIVIKIALLLEGLTLYNPFLQRPLK